MSADGTPDPTPRDTLARFLSRWIYRLPAERRLYPDLDAEAFADAVLSSPEARAAVVAAAPRDELLAALVADGTLTEVWRLRSACGWRGGEAPKSEWVNGPIGDMTQRRLVTRWEPLP